jgi:putative phage-type endonuclease
VIEQRSPEWFAQRVGKVTASRMADVVARTKSGYGASRGNYLAELVAERLTGTPASSYTNAAMQWGIDTEPQARAAYEFFQDATVELVGFIDHPRIGMAGASPDGTVGDNSTVGESGLVEVKCPNTATHIETLLEGNIAEKYFLQMQWQMACTGRQWCDFVSFDPRMPGNMQLFVKRIPRDDQQIAMLEMRVSGFLDELDAKVAALTAKYGELARAA